MSHPFAPMFRKALKASSPEHNEVLEEARALLKKGYKAEEIYTALKVFHQGLIRDQDVETVAEALEEFETYMDE